MRNQPLVKNTETYRNFERVFLERTFSVTGDMIAGKLLNEFTLNLDRHI